MKIDQWFRTNISAPRSPIFKLKVFNFPGSSDEKSGKTEFFEVHERPAITHLITVLFILHSTIQSTFCTFLATCAHWEAGKVNGKYFLCHKGAIFDQYFLLVLSSFEILWLIMDFIGTK